MRVAEDEESVSAAVYESRLRVQFEKIYPKPEWVSKKAENDEEEDGFLQSTRTILQDSSKAKILSPDKLLVTRMTDANQPAYSKVRIPHPNLA